jgi:hypothetical protein
MEKEKEAKNPVQYKDLGNAINREQGNTGQMI